MSRPSKTIVNNTSQQAIRARCFHPSGTFVEFRKEEIEQSIPDRFEKIVRLYSERLAVKTRDHAFTYDDLNKAANRVARAILAQRGEGNTESWQILCAVGPFPSPVEDSSYSEQFAGKPDRYEQRKFFLSRKVG